MKDNRRTIVFISLCVACPFLWLGISIYSAHKGFSDINAWFSGNPEKRLTMIKLEAKGRITLITNATVLNDLNMAIKNKVYSSGPVGFEQTTVRAQINAAHWGELNIGCSKDDRIITLRIPEEFSI